MAINVPTLTPASLKANEVATKEYVDTSIAAVVSNTDWQTNAGDGPSLDEAFSGRSGNSIIMPRGTNITECPVDWTSGLLNFYCSQSDGTVSANFGNLSINNMV